jgi:hypothetical protein
MAVATIVRLSASVTVHENVKLARCPAKSNITIRFGDIVVAAATLGGKYSEGQALGEFKRNPHRFTKHAGWETYAAARGHGLVL